MGNEFISNTEVLKSNNCNYHDASILVKGDITILVDQIACKNSAQFIKCITRKLMEQQQLVLKT